jgi:anti-anti-sigma factor
MHDDGIDTSNLGLLQINILRRPTYVVLALSGELDISTSELLGEAFRRVPYRRADAHVLLDLEQLRFVDSSGLHKIAKLARLMGSRLTVRPGAQRKLFELTALDLTVRLVSELPEPEPLAVAARNVGYVRDIYNLWWLSGLDAMLELVPDDVRWEPSTANGRVLVGSDELRRFWADAVPTPAASWAWFEAIDDDVMIETEHELEDGSRRRLRSMYVFAGSRLVRAITVPATAVGERRR